MKSKTWFWEIKLSCHGWGLVQVSLVHGCALPSLLHFTFYKAEHKLFLPLHGCMIFPILWEQARCCQGLGHHAAERSAAVSAALLFVSHPVSHHSTRVCGRPQFWWLFNCEWTPVTCWELSWGACGEVFQTAQQQGKICSCMFAYSKLLSVKLLSRSHEEGIFIIQLINSLTYAYINSWIYLFQICLEVFYRGLWQSETDPKK